MSDHTGMLKLGIIVLVWNHIRASFIHLQVLIWNLKLENIFLQSSYHSWKTLPKLSDLIIYSFLDTCVQHWTLIFKDQIVLSGMISCDMLAVLCYLWIYSKLVGALSLSKRIFICRCICMKLAHHCM